MIINTSEEAIQIDHSAKFDYRDQKEFKDKEEPELTLCPSGTFNKVIFKMIYDLDECDHSNIEIKVYPQQEGKDMFLHVLIGN